MLRRSMIWLSGGAKEYHEWHLHEPLLTNYEGWRVLDDPQYKSTLEFVQDLGGTVRHTDPIIDDPRLTHQQRVCRLYRWALRDFAGGILGGYHEMKFNMAQKVIRQRFEKYRYVTDPSMCDMMVRETQKYLNFYCGIAHWTFRRNAGSPGVNAYQANVLFHPDHSQNYDHWTQTEVFFYDDAKLHHYAAHHPLYSGARWRERLGALEDLFPAYRIPIILLIGWALFLNTWHLALLPVLYGDSSNERWRTYLESLEYDTTAAVNLEERCQRGPEEGDRVTNPRARLGLPASDTHIALRRSESF